MKKILFIIVFLFSTNVIASENISNSETTINKAIIVENYINNQKTKIQKFLIKYKIQNKEFLKENIIELNNLIIKLKHIQKKNIEQEKAEKILKIITLRIEELNKDLKNKLNKEKNEFTIKLNKKKTIYSKLGIKLSNKINSINFKIASSIYKKDSILSLKESKIKNSLIKLNKESLKLRNFGNINFKSEKDIKESFISILQNIKIEISEMKKILK